MMKKESKPKSRMRYITTFLRFLMVFCVTVGALLAIAEKDWMQLFWVGMTFMMMIIATVQEETINNLTYALGEFRSIVKLFQEVSHDFGEKISKIIELESKAHHETPKKDPSKRIKF